MPMSIRISSGGSAFTFTSASTPFTAPRTTWSESSSVCCISSISISSSSTIRILATVGLLLGHPVTDLVADAGQQLLARHGALVQHVGDAPLQPLALAVVEILGSDDNHRDGLPHRPVAEFVEELEPVHVRHDQVQQNDCRSVGFHLLKGLAAVGGLAHLPAGQR